MAQMFLSAFRALIKPFDSSRRCIQGNYYYLDDPNQSHSLPNVDLESECTIGDEIKKPVSVADFSQHVAQLHADTDIGFSKEYELIQNECLVEEQASEHSQHSDNKSKNRYLNIIACKFPLVFPINYFSPLPTPHTHCNSYRKHNIRGRVVSHQVDDAASVFVRAARVNLNHIN